MADNVILKEKKGHIGIITLNRPDQLNTFSSSLATGFNNALIDFEQDDETRVVIIKGAGKSFCAGIDVSELEGKNVLEYYEWITLMENPFITISKMGKPVIASAHNIAVANGIGIVAASDLAIATEGTKFGATAVNVGLFCMGPAIPLSRNLGRKKTLELLLTGDLIEAAEAERIGLINKVVPKDKLEEKTMELAEKLAAKSPLGVQLGKKSFYKMSDLEYDKAFELTANHFATLCTTEDAHEGVDAFLNKRKPNWKLK
ncbi:short chain enoyl-CoA hydratase [Desulforamulus reducens MI-1]|uniref:Short chain enoyl-CoA hydratase n=1 Tax=Desulforamulus reducens (strain ATCC BAA-1160 / DSM 100696 / MI-1) TaxID=349161 RepID=A4J5E4_DESRM|nr:enoyl-CoA hydratase-related protein [Desulforamulus reducens]ABO50297.1 short chain enoyl-CoA hydratase [Desulforamulus reducens MI-1]